jgi:hypothetical protein
MAVGISNLAFVDPRRDGREDVHYQAKATGPDGRPTSLLVVNISPRGLMARCEAALEAGDTIRLTLPRIGTVEAEVRWSLGGRLGCEFTRLVGLADYYDLIAVLVKK